jgi:hypothetical protein
MCFHFLFSFLLPDLGQKGETMTARFSRNGQSPPSSTRDGSQGKNEVDLRLDRLNSLWVMVEKKLLGMQPPRHLHVIYDTEYFGEDGDYERYCCLGLVRISGRWHVCYGTFERPGKLEEPANWKPIAECSVEVRLKAAKGIELLKHGVEETGKTFIPALDGAIRSLERVMMDDD